MHFHILKQESTLFKGRRYEYTLLYEYAISGQLPPLFNARHMFCNNRRILPWNSLIFFFRDRLQISLLILSEFKQIN